MEAQKVKAVELIYDWNIWPRRNSGELDSANLKRMKETLRAGLSLPPVTVNEKDYRIVDGFHRVSSAISIFGEDAEVMCYMKQYKTDAEMLLESMRLNYSHGLALGPMDILHTILKLRKMKTPLAQIASTIGMKEESIKRMIGKNTAITKSGERLEIVAGLSGLSAESGRVLTEKQEEYIRGKQIPRAIEMYVNMLLRAMRHDVIVYTENTYALLKELKKEIEAVMERAQ